MALFDHCLINPKTRKFITLYPQGYESAANKINNNLNRFIATIPLRALAKFNCINSANQVKLRALRPPLRQLARLAGYSFW